MKNLKQVITHVIFLISLNIVAQTNYDHIQGCWQGTITTPNGNLALLMKIKVENNGIAATMDVPAQRAKNIKASLAWFRHDSLFVEFEMLRARYIAVLKSNRTIEGDWAQGDYEFPLNLVTCSNESEPKEIKHFQEPTKPYPYNEEEVVFENTSAKVKLSGTFTWPKNKENCPVAILISGSGPQDRDEALLGQKPFLVLADHLTKNGIAVLRFDDRGVGKSTGDFSKATSFDFSSDVEAGIQYLKGRKEINKKMIGLIGHSEGGFIAPIVASRTKDVKWMVLMAGPGIKGSDLLLLQSAAISKASGLSVEMIEKNTNLNKSIYKFAGDNLPGTQDSISRLLADAGLSEESIQVQLKSVSSPWFKYFVNADPAVYLNKTKSAVFAINGMKDLQVPYEENLAGIEKSLKKAGNNNYEIKSYTNLNHLFQHCNSGLPSEYGEIEETISPEVLKDIGDWILRQK